GMWWECDSGDWGGVWLQNVVAGVGFSQTQPPAVIMDDDVDVIRIVKGRGGALKRSIIKIPLRRGALPDELVKIVPILVVAEPSALCRKIILVPPSPFGYRRQRL